MKTQKYENGQFGLLEKYIIVKSNFDENSNVSMTLRTKFEETRLCETYNSYGRSVGCCGAGCYALDNSESSAEIDLKSEFDGSLENYLAAQEPMKWFSHRSKKTEYEIPTMIAYDKTKLSEKIEQFYNPSF